MLIVGDLNPSNTQKYSVYKYTPEILETNWEPYKDIVIANAKRLKKLLTPLNFEQYLHLRDKMNSQPKSQNNTNFIKRRPNINYQDTRRFINF